MNSGLQVPEECEKAYKNLALRRKARYLCMAPSADGTTVEILKEEENREAGWPEFIEYMNENENKTRPMWIFFELEWEAADGRKISKVIMVAYAPDDTPDGQGKFLVAANKGMLKNKLKPNRDF